MDEHIFALSPAQQNSQPLTNFQTIATSSWHNITAWVFNVTRHAPFIGELALAGPRMFTKLGSYLAISDSMDSYKHLAPPSRRAFPEAAEANIHNILEPRNGMFETINPGASDGEVGFDNQASSSLSLEGGRGLGSVFNYATSKWAISCIAMAIILNRTHIFAATRRRLRFRWYTRLLLRLLPLILLSLQSIRLLRSIQCQSSSSFSEYRWLDRSKSSDLASAHPNTFFNKLSSVLLLGASDRQSCEAINMVPHFNGGTVNEIHGSLSILWPLFGVLCLSHFIETLCCAVTGRPLSIETGMTLFEQSLAFAEADASANNQLGWGAFARNRHSDQPEGVLGAYISITRSAVLSRVNTSPEVLFIAFLSSMTHVSSHVLGVLDAQSKYRLVNTGFWGFCFMGTIVWSALEFELGNPSTQSLLRFPTVCIIGFVPHVLVLSGIIVCFMIYGLALILSAMAPITNLSASTLRRRLANAHSNMQANVSLAEIRITRDMDFYTALLRTGFAVITMASEAVYLNEERNVNIQQHTWLEEERLREIEELQSQAAASRVSNAEYDQIGTIGLIPVKEGTKPGVSGYGRERAAQKVPRSRSDRAARLGTGATERSSRWLTALDFLLNIARLFVRAGALSMLWLLGWARVRTQPAWLLRLVRSRKHRTEDSASRGKRAEFSSQHTTYLTGERIFPRMEEIDVETEFRRKNANQNEASLDAELYQYWASGGWWGVSDASGDYVPEESNDLWDTTSVLSTSSVGTDDDEASERPTFGNNSQDTLTRTSTIFSRERSPTADTIWDTNHLARLLHPATIEEREEAQALSAHLESDKIITRSAFRRREQVRRSRILLHPGFMNDNMNNANDRNTRVRLDDEDRVLEQIILSRRRLSRPGIPERQPGSDLGMGIEDSQSMPCVVCHTSVRTIIVWPCRCLSLCDDCRVSLAMNNFDRCVCCRRDVLSFSRIFVP